MSFISLKNVSKIYGKDGAKVEALKNVDLNINKGEFISIMGTSGSGKSTLLNILGCLDKSSSGNYFINGIDVVSFSNKKLANIRNKTFGFVVQYFGLIDDFTVFENIQIPLEYSGISKKDRKKLISSVLEDLKISDKIDSTPKELSGGQNQRVAIARALVNNPDVILADEPTGALDKKTAQEIMNILKHLNELGKTIIIVTHDEFIASNCNRIIKIEDGVIIDDRVRS